MKELNEAAQKAKELFENANQKISGNWAKWYHYGIPDFPEEQREKRRKEYAEYGHCKECTSMSGCYFIDGEKTFPAYPHHPHCHCEKIPESPTSINAYCDIRKFINFEFVKPDKKPYMDKMGFDISQSEYLKSEFERQAKEKYISGEYEIKMLNEYGQRINILIEVLNFFGEPKKLISG